MECKAPQSDTSVTIVQRPEACVSVPGACAIVLNSKITAEAHFVSFNGLQDSLGHFVVHFGSRSSDASLVRFNSEGVTDDVFGPARCDCGLQLQEAILRLQEACGCLPYLR